jgi:hypothetical protein
MAPAMAQQENQIKRYPVKSAKVTYQVHSPEGTGTTVLFFDQYGRRESKHETLQKNGKTIKDRLTLLNNGKAYSIDLLTNQGQDVSQATGMAMQMVAGAGGNDISKTGKQMLESMGGRKTGSQQFLGKNCEKWEINTMGKTTILIWQGIPLKTETSVMGIKSVEQATNIQTGLSFTNADFEPPAGVNIEKQQLPVGMGMSDEDRQQLEKIKNMTYADFKKMELKGNPNMTEEEIQQAYKMIKLMSKMIK